MHEQHKLSLLMAVLVNISVMFGVGIFINTVTLAQRAGGLGFLSYMVIAALMAPLILSLGRLLAHYPSGGFYAYAAPLSPLVGFISAWSYFIGKLSSASLLIHVFSRLIQTIIPALNSIPTLGIDLGIIALFAVLNMHNVKTNMSVIYTFVVLKFIPVLTAIITSLILWNYWSLPAETLYWDKIPSSLPIVLFAFVGFEAACSISRTIKNPRVNAPKSIFYSFGLVICITTLYQLLFFLPLNSTLMAQNSYLGAFPSLLTLALPHQPWLVQTITRVIHLCAAAAALGGSYGIMFSNHWNLYTLAEHKHTFFPRLLTTLNRYQVPILCVVIEALVCVGYLVFTQGSQLLLQQISVLGCSISYTFSVAAFLKLQATEHKTLYERSTTYLALGSCIIFLGTCINNLITDGFIGLLVYTLLIGAGIGMFFVTQKRKQANA